MYKVVGKEQVEGLCTEANIGSLAPSKVLNTRCLLRGASG